MLFICRQAFWRCFVEIERFRNVFRNGSRHVRVKGKQPLGRLHAEFIPYLRSHITACGHETGVSETMHERYPRAGNAWNVQPVVLGFPENP
jgi:hypothetical protein